MTIVDLIKDFIDSTKDRIKTPISGAFLWSFIIYNWRPFFLLLFSDASIEDKIIVINHEYCNFGAILFPFLIALLYTILVPKLMLTIDNALVGTKVKRTNNIYDAREHAKDRQIEIARKDFLLKNVESGNKEIEDLLLQIDSLKETSAQLALADKNTIDQLNRKLKEVNHLYPKSPVFYGGGEVTQILINDSSLTEDEKAEIIADQFSPQEGIELLAVSNSKGKFNERLNLGQIGIYLNRNIIVQNVDKQYFLNPIGLKVRKLIYKRNLKK